MPETWVWSLCQEDPLKKGMATHSSTLAWGIPWMEEPGGQQSMESQRVRHNWETNTQQYKIYVIWYFTSKNSNSYTTKICYNKFSKSHILYKYMFGLEVRQDGQYSFAEFLNIYISLWKSLQIYRLIFSAKIFWLITESISHNLNNEIIKKWKIEKCLKNKTA